MSRTSEQPTTLRYPINGIDIATGGVSDTVANCQDALNVRSRSPLTKRVQGGKRSGLVQLLTAAAGAAGARRITGLAAMQRPAQSVQPIQLTTIEVSDDMTQNARERWALNRYFAFRRASGGQASRLVLAHGTINNMLLANGVPKVIEIINIPRTVSGITLDSGIVIDAATGNDISVTFRGRRALNYSGATAGNPSLRSSDSYECSDCGPFINASEDLVECYYAYIEVSPTGNAGTLKLVKIKKSGGASTTTTLLAQSDEFQSGNSTTVGTFDSATIRLYSNSAKVYAQLDWPAAGIALPVLEADVDAGLSGFNRGGILNTRNTEGVSRSIWQCRYRRRQEPSRKIFWGISGGMDMPGQTTQPRYAVPPETVAALVTSAVTGTVPSVGGVQINGTGTWSTSVTEPNHPYVDCLGGYLTALLGSSSNAASGTGATWWPMFCANKTYDPAKTYAPEILFNWDRQRIPGAATATTAPAFPQRDEVTVLLRLDHTDRRTGLALTMRRKYLTNFQNTTVLRLSSDHLLEWRLFEFNAQTGTKTTINSGTGYVDSWLYPYPSSASPTASSVGHTGTLTTKAATVFNVNDWIRITDNTTEIVLSQNGCAILTIPTTTGGGAAANVSGGISTTTRIKTGFGFCMFPFEVVTGQTTSVAGSTTSTTPDVTTGSPAVYTYRCRAAGIRIVDTTQASTDPTPDVGEYDLLIVSGNQPHVAQIRVPETVTSIGSEQMGGQMQQAAVYGGQFYVVDGTNSLMIHPVKREVKQYTATDGIFPAGCELIATFQGAIYLGRQPANPTLWFKSRSGKPQDWDFGSTVDVANKAYFGSSGAIGQPADPLTALCPFMDDFMVMGCASSLYILEGNPGAGGKLTSLNNRIGIVGPRAWCFDEVGTMYFVGAGGLYRLDRGSRVPVPVTGRKLAGFLDAIDTRTTMVQCAYDGHSECVHVFLTPIDGSGDAVHVVYEIPTQALWYDQYPDAAGPWAVCEIDGPTGNSRRILFGGNDGYIRRFDESAKSDDDAVTGGGAAITSRIRFAPLICDNAANEMIVKGLQAVGAPRSGTLNWYLIMGSSGDACEEITDLTGVGGAGQPQRGGTWTTFAGWQPPVGIREANAAAQLVIQQVSATESWAFNLANLMLEKTGIDRKNTP